MISNAKVRVTEVDVYRDLEQTYLLGDKFIPYHPYGVSLSVRCEALYVLNSTEPNSLKTIDLVFSAYDARQLEMIYDSINNRRDLYVTISSEPLQFNGTKSETISLEAITELLKKKAS